MSGYQFGHTEGYARKGGFNTKTKSSVMSGWDIVDEAERKNGATSHIEKPMPPVPIFGVSPSVAMQEAAAWAEQTKDAAGRRLRVDGLCLCTGVISFPADAAGWPEYRAEAVEWLKKKYGDNLRSVVEHVDEAYPHIHFYAVPKIGQRFDFVHDGYRAANEAKAQGAVKGAQNTAYKNAMKAWQDELHAACGVKFGLSRVGPRKQRLTRAQWKERKAVGSQVAALLQQATERKAEADLQADAVLQNAELQAIALLQDATEDAKQQAAEVRKVAEHQAAEFVKKAEEQIQNIELQAAELLQRAAQEKPVSVRKGEIHSVIDTVETQHRAGLLRNGEELYTREQVEKIASITALNAVQKQFKAALDFTAATALAIAKAKTEINEETATELALAKKQVTALSNTIIKKDDDNATLKKQNNEYRSYLENAKTRIENQDKLIEAAKAEVNEENVRLRAELLTEQKANTELRAENDALHSVLNVNRNRGMKNG